MLLRDEVSAAERRITRTEICKACRNRKPADRGHWIQPKRGWPATKYWRCFHCEGIAKGLKRRAT